MCVQVHNFMTVDEAACLRGFSRAYVMELVRQRRLRSEVLFREVLVLRSDVERFKKAKPGRGRPAPPREHSADGA